MLRTDGGGEFSSKNLAEFLHLKGILHQRSCPHTLEQNGVVERKHRHLVETALTLLAQSALPKSLWVEAFHTALHLINRLPIVDQHCISPYQKLFNKEPDYHSLKPFGCKCFPWLRPYTANKLEFRNAECVFIGYSQHYKGYKCWCMSTRKVYLSRHVRFVENVFPLSKLPSFIQSSGASNESSPSAVWFAPISVPTPSSITSTDLSVSSTESSFESSPNIEPSSFPNVSDTSDLPNQVLHTSKHPMQTRSKSGIYKKKLFFSTKHPLPMALISDFSPTPTSYTQASKFLHWRVAMDSEFNALQEQQTWALVPFSQGMNVVGCKWVFHTKLNSDGSLNKHKAWLVAKGFHQQPSVDFIETFSPVVKHSTIRVVLAIAVSKHWTLLQLDVECAFLHGNLQEDVYMEQPQGYADPSKGDYVCKMLKSIYGLRQAPRSWYSKFSSKLQELQFHVTVSDPSLFVYHQNGITAYLLLYVDDIIITSSSDGFVCKLIATLSSNFKMKDLGLLSYFLGISFSRTKEELKLSQSKFILELLDRTDMAGSKPVSSPTGSKKLSKLDGDVLEDPTHYRSVVGALQ